MLAKMVQLSIRLRWVSLAALVVTLVAGTIAAVRLPIDAIPDISPVQVAVLTAAPGYSARDVERMVTVGLENELNGLPGLKELRSVSRADVSAITLIFRDGTDPWFARQLVLERLWTASAALPEGTGPPELAPLSNGLGEIYQFVVRSDRHTPRQLRTMLDWEIVPRLRSVPGIIELNTMGGKLKQYHVVVEPEALRAHGIAIGELVGVLREAAGTASGGYVARGPESYTLRMAGQFAGIDDIAKVVVRSPADGAPILVEHLAQVRLGAALPLGAVSHDGEPAVTGIVMMLVGGNSRDVIYAVKDRVEEIRASLPAGVELVPIYDRAAFVERTLSTVASNLAEGAAVVTLVLVVMLGSLRGALVIVLGIPTAMSVAVMGMHLFGVGGDLMSLGALDFGFLVDGPIVVLEAVLAVHTGRRLAPALRRRAYGETIAQVMRPVLFSVLIILLVYLPLLGLEGVEGKMFRPMAITMACALFGALIYSTLFLPALLAIFVPPPARDGARWLNRVATAYRRMLVPLSRIGGRLLAICAVALVGAMALVAGGGADFVPRIDEGDMVVTIRRSPSIDLDEAERLDQLAQAALREFPEVVTTLAMTGRAEVATDPVGVDNTDILVHLRPKPEWTTAHDLDALAEVFKNAVESATTGTFASVSQPIEDRTNELVSGSRADVQIMLYGEDLDGLGSLATQLADLVRTVDGTGDVRVERTFGMPELTIRPDRARMARHGVRMADALTAIEAARVGVPLGDVYEGQRRFGVRLLVPPSRPDPAAIERLPVESSGAATVPLAEVADVVAGEGPPQIRREDRQRTVRVDVNLRGRDLVSWVNEARAVVKDSLEVPPGFEVEWGGQFENFDRAARRLAIVVPLALGIVLLMLVWMFGNLRDAISVFVLVPIAITGGALGLWARDLPFSIPAAVGFVALAGVAVLDGVVLTQAARDGVRKGLPLDRAIIGGSVDTMRAVLTTGAVAALGFVPMTLATGAGAEVQRPLATVVVCGVGLSTVLTLFVLPGVLRMWMRAERPSSDDDATDTTEGA